MKKYKDNGNMPWLDGYNLGILKELYNRKEQINEVTDEIYKVYIECVNKPYGNSIILNKYIEIGKSLKIRNYGNIMFKIVF